MRRHVNKVLFFALSLCVTCLGCSGVGLVTEHYPERFYRVPKLQPELEMTSDATFIIYSDSQGAWRAFATFWTKSSWTNWRMLIFPFYQLYLVGNGIVGATNWLRHSPDSGAAERRLVRDAIYAEAKRSQASFVLSIGDMVADDGRRPAHWARFLRENRVEHPLLNEIPYLPVLGNHERGNDREYGFPNFDAVFGYPRFFVVEFPNASLFVLDSNLLVDSYQHIDDNVQDDLFREWFVSEDAERPSWLERQLLACDKRFKMVAMHASPVSFGVHHSDWLKPSHGRNLTEKRSSLLRLFESHNVQVVFSGHDHLYQHSILKHDDGRLLHFIVGGSGGGSLRGLADEDAQRECLRHFRNAGMHVSLVKQARIYNYHLVHVTSEGVAVEVIEVSPDREDSTRPVEEIRIGTESGPHP
jgi:hypothetical protein